MLGYETPVGQLVQAVLKLGNKFKRLDLTTRYFFTALIFYNPHKSLTKPT